MIESWMVSLGAIIVTLIGVFYITRYRTELNEKNLIAERREREKAVEANKRSIDAIGKKLDEATKEVAEHQIRLANAPSMEQVRAEFVSKEMLAQIEKHFDEKIDTMGKTIGRALDQVLENQMLLADKLERIKEK